MPRRTRSAIDVSQHFIDIVLLGCREFRMAASSLYRPFRLETAGTLCQCLFQTDSGHWNFSEAAIQKRKMGAVVSVS
jgi:hypothetical protein